MQRQQREAVARQQQGYIQVFKDPTPAKARPTRACAVCESYGTDACPHKGEKKATCPAFTPEVGAYAG